MNYTFCPQCKNKLTKETESFYCENCRETIYLNSKPTASVLIIDNDKVLLGKRSIEPNKGSYDVIGGFLELGELPEEGAIREAMEETGLTVKLTGLLGIYMDIYQTTGDHTLNFYYLGEIVAGKMKANDDVASLEWVSINNLPSNPAFASQKKVFQDLQKLFPS